MHLSVLQEGINQGEPRVGVGTSSGTVRCCSSTQGLGVSLKSRHVNYKSPPSTFARCGDSPANCIKHHPNIQSLWQHEINARSRDPPACRTAADLVLFWKVKNINVNALVEIWQLCMRYDVQEEKNQQLPTSAQSELTARLFLLRIITLKTCLALSIWPIDRPSRKDFLVANELKTQSNVWRTAACRWVFSAVIKSALENHLSHPLWEHHKHQTR